MHQYVTLVSLLLLGTLSSSCLGVSSEETECNQTPTKTTLPPRKIVRSAPKKIALEDPDPTQIGTGFGLVRGGYYYLTNGTTRLVYSNGALTELEWNGTISPAFFAWGSFSFVYISGYTLGGLDNTRIYLCPFTLGIKGLFFPNSFVRPYLGAGLSANYLNVHVDSKYLIRSQSDWEPGFTLKFGTILLYSHLVFDFFMDYSTVTMHAGGNSLHLGGLSFGLGAGGYF